MTFSSNTPNANLHHDNNNNNNLYDSYTLVKQLVSSGIHQT